MTWLQLTLTVHKDQAEVVEAALEAAGALSVTYADAADQPLLEPLPGATRLWRDSRVTGLFEQDVDADLARAVLADSLAPETLATLEQAWLEDQQWERAWLDDFHPTCFGQRLWVCPAGQRPPREDAVVMDLDPGLAFGTGTHPTTALCLRWLDAHPPADNAVLDYGCGSGILGIAALLLGASSVDAVDYDPQALLASHDNAAKNGLRAHLHTWLPEQAPQHDYPLVLANILAGPLMELAPLLGQRVAPRGRLVLSGILEEQAEQVIAAYAERFAFAAPRVEDGWVLLVGTRRNA